MARKGIKHNNYTVEFIQEVLEKYYSGQGGFTSLANEYKIPIKTWIYRTNKGINVFKNKKYIRNKLLEISNNRQYKILIGCSKGRLRSPAVWLYARFLGIDAKILKYGVKHYAN